MSDITLEKKGGEGELCFYEKFMRVVYDVASNEEIRFIEMESLAKCYVGRKWVEYMKLLEKVRDSDKYAFLGDLYWYGRGTNKSVNKAVEMYQKGLEMGSGYAAVSLGDAFWLGGGVEQNDEKAVELYRTGLYIKSGHAAANLGDAFWQGRGVEQNYKKAIELFRKGIKMKCGYAAAKLGDAFWYGKGVEQNYEKAIELYRKGMVMGNGYAAAELGCAFWLGRGIEQNVEKAIELHIKGVKMGSRYAERRLKEILNKMEEFSNGSLDILWGIDNLPTKVRILVLERKLRLSNMIIEKQERELKKLQLERSRAGKVLGRNLCGVISDFI